MAAAAQQEEFRFRPFPGPQREFWNDTSREILLSSGWGAGKTRVCLEKADFYARKFAPTKVLICRKVNADLPGSTLDELFSDVLPEEHIEQKHKQEQWVELTNGSRIYWTGLDRREKVGSTEFGYIFVDEAAELEKESDEEEDDLVWLRGRLRIDDVGFHQLAAATNPPREGKSHWLYDYYFENPRRRVYHLNPLDNPHLDEDYKDDLRRLDGVLGRRFREGEWTVGEGTWLKRDMLEFVEASELGDHSLRWIVTIDIGIEDDPEKAEEEDTDYWAATIFGYDSLDQVLYLIDCRRDRGMTKDQALEWLKRLMAPVPTNRVYIEGVGGQHFFVQDAAKAGFDVVGLDQVKDKDSRLMFLSIPFNRGKAKIVNHDPPEDRAKDEYPSQSEEWDARWDPFVQEWTAFPKGKKDLLDTTEMGLRQVDLGLQIQAYTGHAYGEA